MTILEIVLLCLLVVFFLTYLGCHKRLSDAESRRDYYEREYHTSHEYLEFLRDRYAGDSETSASEIARQIEARMFEAYRA